MSVSTYLLFKNNLKTTPIWKNWKKIPLNGKTLVLRRSKNCFQKGVQTLDWCRWMPSKIKVWRTTVDCCWQISEWPVHVYSFDVVEIETKETWRWFLNLLFKDIGDVETNKWVFISDQQKVKKLYTLIVLYYVVDIFWIIFMSYFMCRDYNKFFWNFQPR